MTRPPKSRLFDTLGELASQNAVPALQEFVAWGARRQQPKRSKLWRRAPALSIERIETWAVWSSAIETIFRGVSLSSILLIMSVGLAIVFGLMGVINMAHGELMMVGAYATFITQEIFKAFVLRPRCLIIISRPRCRWHFWLPPLAGWYSKRP